MLKCQTLHKDMSQNNISVSFHAYTRNRPTTEENSNCSLVKLKGKENWNQDSHSGFISKFQDYNRLSTAVTVYPLAPTWGGKKC